MPVREATTNNHWGRKRAGKEYELSQADHLITCIEQTFNGILSDAVIHMQHELTDFAITVFIYHITRMLLYRIFYFLVYFKHNRTYQVHPSDTNPWREYRKITITIAIDDKGFL